MKRKDAKTQRSKNDAAIEESIFLLGSTSPTTKKTRVGFKGVVDWYTKETNEMFGTDYPTPD